MSWEGYLTLDGGEIINAARFEAYAGNAPWFKSAYGHVDLESIFGDYTDPASDNAPWYDPNLPASADFYGVFPLSVVGLDSSSRQANVTESTGEGGVPGRVRHATKEITASVMLGAASPEGLEAGMVWLRRALLGALCSPRDARNQPLGADLGFLASLPHLEFVSVQPGFPLELDTDGVPYVAPDETDPGSLVDIDDDGTPFMDGPYGLPLRFDTDHVPYLLIPLPELNAAGELASLARFYRRTAVTSGPTVNSTQRMRCGGAMALVTFTFTAGDPYVYGLPNAFLSGTDGSWGVNVPLDADPDSVNYDSYAYTDVPCAPFAWDPLYDPLCSAFIAPPTAPNVPLNCFATATYFHRQTVEIPAVNVPLWSDLVPMFKMHTGPLGVCSLRLRLFPDGDLVNVDSSPCAATTDVVIGWAPANAVLSIDFSDGSATVVYDSLPEAPPRRADTLIYASDGTPAVMGVLTCGVPYKLVIDWPTSPDALAAAISPTSVDMILVPRAV